MTRRSLTHAALGLTLVMGLAHGAGRTSPRTAEAAIGQGVKAERAAVEDTAHGEARDAAGLPILVMKTTVYDAGLIKQGTPIENTFIVENEGKADLRILKIQGG